jgi:hypothetical protein
MPTPEEIQLAVAKIDRRTDHLQSEMERVAQHRKLLLEAENPDAVLLQDAIIEKNLRDSGLLSQHSADRRGATTGRFAARSH